MRTKVQDFHVFASARLGEIEGRLNPGAKLTLVIRNDNDPDQDIVLSNGDAPDEAIAALERSKTRAPVEHP